MPNSIFLSKKGTKNFKLAVCRLPKSNLLKGTKFECAMHKVERKGSSKQKSE